MATTKASTTVSTAATTATVTKKTAAVTTAAATVTAPTPTVQVAAATGTPAAATVPAAVTAQVVSPATGLVGFLNHVVTNLLNPFLNPAPNSPEPFTPALWAVLGWVRRNVFNQAPTIAYNPTTTVQTGQTLTGNIGATDAENDTLKYKVTQGPKYGTLSVDQATGNFTYTPADIDYGAVQTDSFTVAVTDGKFNLLNVFSPHRASVGIDVSVLSPTIQRVILNLPAGIGSPANPRYSADGKSIFFAGQPTAGGRSEIYQIGIDGTGADCVTCGVATNETGNLMKPVPVEDGSGRVLVLVQDPGKGPRYSLLEDGVNGRQLVPVTTPPGGGFAIDQQREMRVSPDGKHVLFTRIVLGPNNLVQALPIVGTLVRTADGYEVDDARVVYPTGEGKQWTPDGKGVVILGGAFEAGNVDDIEVDLATGNVTRVTANLDYDEDMDFSPNEKWIAIGSTRGLNALTPMTRIIRPNFLPAYVSAPVYDEYALPINVSNQEWLVSLDDELKRENGIPLFVEGDGYTARSMPSWNPNGDAITFWESSITDPTVSRLVIANLKYTTSVGPVAADRTTPTSDSWAPQLGNYVATTTPLPAVGAHAGVGGGTALVTEVPDPNDATRTIRTVVYTDYVNELGEVLNGTESADYNAGQTAVHYLADINVTGAHTGYLKADATVNAFAQSLTGFITSSVDGDVQSLPNPAAAEEAQQNA
ncbi:VCBS domain-containing protein [Mycobacterium sp. BMJ-28]